MTVTFDILRCPRTGSLQASIGVQDERGYGHGYRLFGPKFAGDSEVLRSHTLTPEDAREIRRYLDLIEPESAPEGDGCLSCGLFQCEDCADSNGDLGCCCGRVPPHEEYEDDAAYDFSDDGNVLW